ncbi:anti-sigma factor antagonist [Candidatus Moduliflexus flocculans]|uniref:Anti-sigma factor antagonist n=1 Tax=Candidatus Moduliflexus flocculans TaxID=1499966 RepID=A0A0S6VY43_9BACT|nr:anti-sigma factor antagonist [Candidatus Moduliflexus flocculans]
MNRVDIHVEKVGFHSDTVIVRIDGPLDTVASYNFQEKMERLLQSGVCKFVVNLEHLEYISSAGIGIFPGLSQDLKQKNGGLVFANVSPKIVKLFEMIGLTTIFPIRGTTEEALKEFLPDES